ncbi:MAG: hypothetical protein H6736_01510 [Alphaproteobacteria bacterium]|nr:hypothetical protein [Alphaproteobacteria bacterium]
MLAMMALAFGGEVVVARRDLAPGHELQAADVYLAWMPDDFVPPGTFRSVEEVVGRVPMEVLLADGMVRAERLVAEEAGVGLQALVPRGMRIVRLELPRPHGHIQPGSQVDVVDADGRCIVGQAVHVLATEDGAQGVTMEPWTRAPAHFLHVAVEAGTVGRFAALGPARTEVLLRNPIDVRVAGRSCEAVTTE